MRCKCCNRVLTELEQILMDTEKDKSLEGLCDVCISEISNEYPDSWYPEDEEALKDFFEL